MRLRVLRSAWGLRLHDGARALEPARVLDGVAAAGLDGLEASLDDLGALTDLSRGAEWMRAARERDLTLVLSAYSSWRNYGSSYDSNKLLAEHSTDLLHDLRVIAELHHGAIGSPLAAVNCHTGSDCWTEAEGARFFAALAKETPALRLPSVTHETHRARFLASPFVTARLLAAVPSVRLTSDFSHWVVASERLLDSPSEATLLNRQIAPAVDHIHARLGTPQCPQLAEPDLPSAARSRERFYGWWEQVWAAKEATSFSARDSIVTATVEYGPWDLDEAGENVGYAPSRPGFAVDPTGSPPEHLLDATIGRAATRLRDRFERWHTQAVWRGLDGRA